MGDIRGRALGLLHISPVDFGLMTAGEFWEAWKAYQDEKKADRRHLGELARGLAIHILNPFCKGAINDAESFWTMPWDDKAADDAETRRIESLPMEEKQLEAQKLLDKINKSNGIKGQSES